MFQASSISKIIVYGMNLSEQIYKDFIEKWRNKYQIVAISDENSGLSQFKISNKNSIMPSKFLDFDALIVIAGDNWKIGMLNLISKGFAPFRDFIPEWVLELYTDKFCISYSAIKNHIKAHGGAVIDYINFIALDKKIAIIYGNCQIEIIECALMRTRAFTNEYVIVMIPPIFIFEKTIGEDALDEQFIQKASLFLHQNINVDNRFSQNLSTDYIKSFLSASCKIISFPNTYFKGYFPQYDRTTLPVIEKDLAGNQNYIFPYGDIAIEKLASEGNSAECIYKTITSDDFMSAESIKENLKQTLNELKSREELCDVKISDYIEENFQKEYLFYTVNHPTNKTLYEVTERILKKIGYTDFSINTNGLKKFDGYTQLIYPCVKKALNIEFEVDNYNFNSHFVPNFSSFENFVKIYVEYYVRHSENC